MRFNKHVLVQETSIDIVRSDQYGSRSSTPQQLGVALLSTCRQVHMETSGIVYGQNTFTILAGRDTSNTGKAIGRAADWLIRIGRQCDVLQELSIVARIPRYCYVDLLS